MFGNIAFRGSLRTPDLCGGGNQIRAVRLTIQVLGFFAHVLV